MIPLPLTYLARPIAHRGFHNLDAGRPENSRAAFEAAIAHGYAIELDVQMTRDEQAIVFHDYDLRRLTPESGPIRQRTLAEMQTIPLIGGETCPEPLSDILSLIDGRVPVLLEIKDQDGAMGLKIGDLEQSVSKAIQNYSGAIAVMSFNPNTTATMAKLLPNVPRGLVTSPYTPGSWPFSRARCAELREIPDYDRAQASFISHEFHDLDRPRVRELKDQGATILCWTVTSQSEADLALSEADNITFEGFSPA
ncbi:MAG: glycerophosphodiester phosphodiesterase family protein [Litoreibacter sp.]